MSENNISPIPGIHLGYMAIDLSRYVEEIVNTFRNTTVCPGQYGEHTAPILDAQCSFVGSDGAGAVISSSRIEALLPRAYCNARRIVEACDAMGYCCGRSSYYVEYRGG